MCGVMCVSGAVRWEGVRGGGDRLAGKCTHGRSKWCCADRLFADQPSSSSSNGRMWMGGGVRQGHLHLRVWAAG